MSRASHTVQQDSWWPDGVKRNGDIELSNRQVFHAFVDRSGLERLPLLEGAWALCS